MPADDSYPTPPPLPAEKQKWQFSLRELMMAMTGFALFSGFASLMPTAFSQILLGAFWIAASGWLITGVVFAKGDIRAFSIGAIVVASSMWTGIGGRFAGGIQSYLRGIPFAWAEGPFLHRPNLELWLIHLILAGTAIANGYLCIRARRYFDRHSDA